MSLAVKEAAPKAGKVRAAVGGRSILEDVVDATATDIVNGDGSSTRVAITAMCL
jgi:hypothetical protein